MTDVGKLAQRSIDKGSTSFAAAARLLPRLERESAVMLYSWCRHCDDAIDGQVLGHGAAAVSVVEQRERLASLQADTLRALGTDEAVAPPFEALRRVVRRFDIPRRHPLELLDGFAMDVAGRSYETIENTLDYAYHVAGVVGVMMGYVLGTRDRATIDRACDLGIAFQLTNIARDVIDDLGAGRVYLPREWLAAEGVEAPYAEARDHWNGLHRCALRLLSHAEPYYQSARIGAAALPRRSAWGILSALAIYREIGCELRARGPGAWEKRVRVSGRRKASMIFGSLLQAARIRQAAHGLGHERGPLWTRP